MSENNTTNILNNVRKLLGSDEYFDPDLITHINSVFSRLQQLGVGPENGFAIEDGTEEWDEFTEDEPILNMVKSYMVLQVKLLFDTSTTSSYVLDVMNRQSQEFEWRLRQAAEELRESSIGKEG